MTAILHVLDHSLPLHSGYSFRTRSILDAQRARGWSVSAVTSSKHESSWKRDTPSVEEIDGVRYYRSGPSPANRLPFAGERALIDRLARRIAEAAAIERPHLLHAHSPVITALAGLSAGGKLRLPVVYEIRAFWEDAAVDHGTYASGSWKYRLTRAVETWACRRVSQITVLCRGLEEDLAARGIPRDRMVIIPNGIDPEQFAHAVPDEEYRARWNLGGRRVAAFLGSFYHYEGLDLLVRAYARLRSKLSDLALLLVGGGEMERDLRDLVQELGLADGVIFAGRVPQERVPGIYALADVLVYPRYPMRLTQLVTPLKPLEAMATGKALVASDVGGHRELIQDGLTGVLFRAGEVEALVETLGRVLGDPAWRRSLGEAGKAWVAAERSWQRTTAPYADVYARATGSAAASERKAVAL